MLSVAVVVASPLTSCQATSDLTSRCILMSMPVLTVITLTALVLTLAPTTDPTALTTVLITTDTTTSSLPLFTHLSPF